MRYEHVVIVAFVVEVVAVIVWMVLVIVAWKIVDCIAGYSNLGWV